MNIAVILAGGQSSRLNDFSRPKQFLEYGEKPIVVYTIEAFQQNTMVDAIVVVCLEDWIPYLRDKIEQYSLSKVEGIVPGGKMGQDSIYNALLFAEQHYPKDSLMLIHDGVRPLVLQKTITECINIAREQGSCVTCVPTMETVLVQDSVGAMQMPNRANCLTARAPQCFPLGDLLAVHRQARADERHDFVDTCTMMHHYGHTFQTIVGSLENIKITIPADFYLFCALMEACKKVNGGG